MGEARYYGKLVFGTEVAAREAVGKVEEFLKRVWEAGERWQSIRGKGKTGDKMLRKEFPEVFERLKIKAPGGSDGKWTSLNYLAGQLDSPYGEEDFDIRVRGEEICFAGTVWHFAEWDSMMDALQELTGAVSSGWLSDEYVENDYWEMIKL